MSEFVAGLVSLVVVIVGCGSIMYISVKIVCLIFNCGEATRARHRAARRFNRYWQ